MADVGARVKGGTNANTPRTPTPMADSRRTLALCVDGMCDALDPPSPAKR